VRNKQPRWEQVEAAFRVRGRAPELWDAVTGHIRPQYEYWSTNEGTAMPLQLAPHGSVFVVFRSARAPAMALKMDQPPAATGIAAPRVDAWDGSRVSVAVYQPGHYRITTGDRRAAEWQVGDIPAAIELRGPWDVRFVQGPAAPPPARFEKLIPWTEHTDEGIRHFSGIAEYRHSFDVPSAWLARSPLWQLDLGDLWSVGEVTLNGHPLGVVWRPPYVVDLPSAALGEHNELVVQIANAWSNRLVGDAGLPPERRVTRTNVAHTNGRRWSDTPLLRSGLFGPVRLLPGRIIAAEPR